MKLRDKPIYLSYEVWRSLWLLSKAESQHRDFLGPDEIADQILRQAIREQHSRLMEHQAEIAKTC